MGLKWLWNSIWWCSFGNDFAGNVVIFGVDNTSSSHTSYHKNGLVLGEGLTDDTTGRCGFAEQKFSTNFSKASTKCCLSLH